VATARLHGSYARGSLLFRNVEGDLRTYRFEVFIDDRNAPSEPTITVSPDDNAFNRSYRTEIKGLPSGQRKDLRARVLMIAKTLIEKDTAQQQWLLGEFAKGQPLVVPNSRPGATHVTHRGWRITHEKGPMVTRVYARRLTPSP
jgi:hypothetical protein